MPDGLERLTILHTNDIHSQFEQMPKIKSYIDAIKQVVDADHVLILDIGDHMDRMRLETEGTLGQVNIEILNESGYEFMVLGNNEGLTFTPEVLERTFRDHAKFQVIASNLIETSTMQPSLWMNPYVIVHKSNLRIGLIGVTAAYTVYYELLGWQAIDPILAISHYVDVLREQVDVLIVMSHLGLGMDQRIANEIQGIDIILGGHTHHLLEQPLVIGSTSICAAGKLGQHVGHVTVTFDRQANQIREIVARADEVSHLPNDRDIEVLIARHRAWSNQVLDQEVTHLQEPLDVDWYSESRLGNLLASGLRTWTNAEIGLVNSGQLLHGLKQGRVTRAILLEICPGPINPCSIKLRGVHLLQAFEESLQSEYTGKPIRGFGFRGEVLGMLHVDGVRIHYDRKLPPMKQITAVYVNHEPLELEREYLVGTIDMFTFGVGYLSLSQGTEITYRLPEFLRDVLCTQLCDATALHHSQLMQNWFSQ